MRCNAKYTPELVRQGSGIRSGGDQVITIATSLIPGKNDIQKLAVNSWLSLGFQATSINAEEELEALLPVYPEVSFAAAKRHAGHKFGKPYIYFDDVLAYLAEESGSIGGIVNSDVILVGHHFYEKVYQEAMKAFIYGSRVEIDSLHALQGNMYDAGFDFFFFDKQLISLYPPEEFCLGVPWWDYWALIIPLIAREKMLIHYPVKKVINPVAFHIKHPVNWNRNSWHSMGCRLSKYLGIRKELDVVAMHWYLQKILSIINTLSQTMTL